MAGYRETDMALAIAASVRTFEAGLSISHCAQGRVKPQVTTYPFKEWLTALDKLASPFPSVQAAPNSSDLQHKGQIVGRACVRFED